ncbi:MAG TPA: Mpo1-like protein [Thermoanaerobaculia bacterium]|nr:Mpo1-like protein [Thermoanaerobaculia bacterium]
MRKIEGLFADYASHHQTAGNKICHRIGIPLIVFSLFGLLQKGTLLTSGRGHLDGTMLLIAASTIYYLTLEVRLAVMMLIASVAMYEIALHVPWPVHLALFVIGWILQFIGHGTFEKRRPAFLRNFVHLLIGPLWILNDVLHVVPDTPVPVAE